MAPLIPRQAPWRDIVSALAGAQKSNRNVAAYSRFINRPFGRVLAATAYKLGMTPNQVTAVSACFSFAGIALLAFGPGQVWTGVVVSLLLIVGYALDSADGQVARLSGGGSGAGEWLDHVIDCTKMSSFHLAVAVLWFRHLGQWPLLSVAIPLVFSIQAAVWFFAIILTELLGRVDAATRGTTPEKQPSSPLNTLIMVPADYGFLALTMLLLGFTTVWRIGYAALMIYNVLLLLVQLVRWYRRVAALSR